MGGSFRETSLEGESVYLHSETLIEESFFFNTPFYLIKLMLICADAKKFSPAVYCSPYMLQCIKQQQQSKYYHSRFQCPRQGHSLENVFGFGVPKFGSIFLVAWRWICIISGLRSSENLEVTWNQWYTLRKFRHPKERVICYVQFKHYFEIPTKYRKFSPV